MKQNINTISISQLLQITPNIINQAHQELQKIPQTITSISSKHWQLWQIPQTLHTTINLKTTNIFTKEIQNINLLQRKILNIPQIINTNIEEKINTFNKNLRCYRTFTIRVLFPIVFVQNGIQIAFFQWLTWRKWGIRYKTTRYKSDCA